MPSLSIGKLGSGAATEEFLKGKNSFAAGFCRSFLNLSLTCEIILSFENSPVPGNLIELSSDMETNLEEPIRSGFSESTVSYGGPVAPEAFSCIHGYGEVHGSKKIAPGVFIGGSKELLSLVKLHRFNATDAMFTQGHGAWGPGQMEEEIANGVWYPASCSSAP